MISAVRSLTFHPDTCPLVPLPQGIIRRVKVSSSSSTAEHFEQQRSCEGGTSDSGDVSSCVRRSWIEVTKTSSEGPTVDLCPDTVLYLQRWRLASQFMNGVRSRFTRTSSDPGSALVPQETNRMPLSWLCLYSLMDVHSAETALNQRIFFLPFIKADL